MGEQYKHQANPLIRKLENFVPFSNEDCVSWTHLVNQWNTLRQIKTLLLKVRYPAPCSLCWKAWHAVVGFFPMAAGRS